MRYFLSFVVVVLSFVPFANASDAVSVIVNGKTYSCTDSSSSGGACACVVEGSYTYYKLNGTTVTYWSGSGGDAMVNCVTHIKKQNICGTITNSCSCKVEGSYTYLHLNGATVTYWSGSGGDAMVNCEEYRRKQEYCR